MPTGAVYQPTTVTYEQQPTDQRWNCPISYFSRRVTSSLNRAVCFSFAERLSVTCDKEQNTFLCLFPPRAGVPLPLHFGGREREGEEGTRPGGGREAAAEGDGTPAGQIDVLRWKLPLPIWRPT
ncbi:hypothetical protein EVAR_12876_1 [Eumeta japonica]|uniref:Uncharacterized protein n=1 Tax=Eumeta variegata TaxID=151549 RepID=A0A4C1TVQ7_EUMVA|nr:hypothetical protein EVAR_12876_1 [Eumeta japonica]